MRWLEAGACTVLLLAADRLGFAAEPVTGRFALDRHEPTPVGDRFFNVPSGAVDGALALRAGVSLDYAHEPLLLQDARGEVLGSAVTSQLVTHLGGSLALWDQVLVSASLPLALINSGEHPGAAASPSGAAVGDLRVGVRVQLAGTRRGPAELGLGTYLWLPTGEPAEYMGDSDVRSMPHLALNGAVGSSTYGVHVGVILRETVEVLDVSVGTAAAYGVAGGYELLRQQFMVGAEVIGSTVLASAAEGNATNAEIHVCARLRLGDFAIGAAAGPGVTTGVGTPAFRALTTLEYGRDVRALRTHPERAESPGGQRL